MYSKLSSRKDTGSVSPVGERASNIRTIFQDSAPVTIICEFCEANAIMCCLDCSQYMCDRCSQIHSESLSLDSDHLSTNIPRAILRGAGASETQFSHLHQNRNQQFCHTHYESFQYVCRACKSLLCEVCIKMEHKQHDYLPIQCFLKNTSTNIKNFIKIVALCEQHIENTNDKLAYQLNVHLQRNCNGIKGNIHHDSYSYLRQETEKRRQAHINSIESLLRKRLLEFRRRICTLKFTFFKLEEIFQVFNNIDDIPSGDKVDLALKITEGERQLKELRGAHRNLQMNYESFILGLSNKNVPSMNSFIEASETRKSSDGIRNDIPVTSPLFIPETSPRNSTKSNLLRVAQCIPGSFRPIKIRKSLSLSLSFGIGGRGNKSDNNQPWGICVDKSGNILVCDRYDHCVRVFRADGTLKFGFGGRGRLNGTFNTPCGICIDINGRIIVVDTNNHRVQIFTEHGRFLFKFGCLGFYHGQFQFPCDVAVNAKGEIVVTDSHNNRIQQFNNRGEFLRLIKFGNNEEGYKILLPRGICYTPEGNIVFSDEYNHCLHIFDPEANKISPIIGIKQFTFEEYNFSDGLCCDDDGNILAIDLNSQRIIILMPIYYNMYRIDSNYFSLNMQLQQLQILNDTDRIYDVALLPDGRIIFSRELTRSCFMNSNNPNKDCIHIL